MKISLHCIYTAAIVRKKTSDCVAGKEQDIEMILIGLDARSKCLEDIYIVRKMGTLKV